MNSQSPLIIDDPATPAPVTQNKLNSWYQRIKHLFGAKPFTYLQLLCWSLRAKGIYARPSYPTGKESLPARIYHAGLTRRELRAYRAQSGLTRPNRVAVWLKEEKERLALLKEKKAAPAYKST